MPLHAAAPPRSADIALGPIETPDGTQTFALIRDISTVVGLTERTVQAIVADLEAAGYLTRDRAGRRNVYTVNPDMLFRHPAQEGHRVGPFLDLLAAAGDDLTESVPGPTGEPGSEREENARRSELGRADS